MVTRSQINSENMRNNPFPGILTSAGREKSQTEIILAGNFAFLAQFREDPSMELMSLLSPTNVLAEMELLTLLMYQEQLLLMSGLEQQQRENYFFSTLAHRQAVAPHPQSYQPSEEESCSQSEPLDLSLPGSLYNQQRSRARSPACECPLCGKQFSRPWLLKGKPGGMKLTSFLVKLLLLRTHENSHGWETVHLCSLS